MAKPITSLATTDAPKPKRPRVITSFDEAKSAQSKLDAIELKRREIMDGLSDEAAAMLEALDELRAKQPIKLPDGERDVEPSSPDVTRETRELTTPR